MWNLEVSTSFVACKGAVVSRSAIIHSFVGMRERKEVMILAIILLANTEYNVNVVRDPAHLTGQVLVPAPSNLHDGPLNPGT